MNSLDERIEALERVAHEPQDIAPRVIEELARAVLLLEFFKEVPTDHLEYYARVGTEMRQYFKEDNDPRGVDR